ncbi:desmoglein-4-like [Nyctibius grandis]|uniref:desmoglein-4-like n=1 Tax=Nyctibius grandis TaxID=48427 RepID=UPI0035BC11DE
MDWLPHRMAAFLFLLLVLLDFSTGFHVEVKEWDENGTAKWKTFRRQKREWIKFAAACREGEDNSKRNPIAKIRSDCEENHPVTYSISGVGIDRAPYGIFVINPRTGEINITSIVDREVTPVFVIRCFAKHSVTGVDLEPPLELRVRVLDINDNPPIFAQTVFTGSIEENSMDNTLVMKIIATDADEPNHLNSKIAFKIESQEPSGPPMFIMNKYTGELHLANYLDREQHSSYTLVVKASDRDGAADGISSLCSCNVKVIDVNDNFPTLAQSSFSASISENSLSSDLLRIQALDADEEFTDNWLAEFFFISGNEDNCFEIVTDRATNQGILRVIKELNYEQLQSHSLIIGVRNVAAFHHSVAHDYQISGTPLTIQVKNVIEPPRFHPSSVVFSIPESTRVNQVVGTYTAIDEDTGVIASNVVYSIGRDPGAWFRINQNTGEITLNKVINRESIYVINGQYKAEVLAITRGVPRYTATGTIVLSMQDMNDNCPIINTELRKVCMHSPSVIITAKHRGGDTYGTPFTFSIHGEPQTTWIIRSINASSAELVSQNIDFYIYRIYVSVRDNQGRHCRAPHIIPVQACQCDSRNYCTSGATKIVIIGGGASGGGSAGGGGGAVGGGSAGGSAGGGVGSGGVGGGGVGGGGQEGGGGIEQEGGGNGEFRPGGGETEDHTDWQGYTDGYSESYEGYTAATDDTYNGQGSYGRNFPSSTTLSGAAIGLMFLGGLIFVLIPILMSMSDCCGCGPGVVGGVGTGFEPVPECTEGAIHPWGIEGAQPEDRDVSHILAPTTAAGGDFCEPSDIYTNTYGGGGVVASGVEETTGVGYGTGTGYGTAGGISGTGEVKGSIGGTIKEYREGGVNMAFLDNYFSEKAFVYADEDEGRPANDCLLIYDHEGVGTPVGSVGCCSFIGEDLDETYLDTLGPKFKTLAEICLGKEIEPFPDANPSWPCINVTLPNPESDLNLPPPGTTIIVNGSAPMPPPVGTTTVITENTYTSGSTIQPPRPMTDPLLHGNMTVTETYTSGSPSLCVDPLRASNVVVTERVVGPASASDLHGMLDIPDLTEGSNVIVTERVIAPNSRLPASLSIPDLVDGSNVVVTERVFRPASGMPGSLINIPAELSNAHNVVVTERVVSGSGVSSLGATSLGGANLGGLSSLGATSLGGANLGGLSSTGQMLSADCHLGQAMGTASPGTSRRRVTKYSTVQYSSQ